MTQEQFLNWVKTTIALFGGLLISKGKTDESTVQLVTGVVIAVVPFVWGWLANTKLAQIKKAANLDEVEKVVIRPSTGNGIAAAAADPAQPKITK